DAHEAAVGVVPHNHEAAARLCSHVGVVEILRGICDMKLSAQLGSRARIALCGDVPWLQTLPHDHEAAGGVRGHCGRKLGVVCKRVDLELSPSFRAVAVEALSEEAVSAAILAYPHNDKAAVRGHRGCRCILKTGRVRVDLKLGAELGSCADVALTK